MNTQYRKNLKAVMEKSKEYTDNIYTLATNNIAGKDTSTTILAFTSDRGVWVGSDTGYWYYWDGTQYVEGGVYQATQIAEDSVNITLVSNDFKLIKNQINGFYNMTFEIGSIASNNGQFITSTTRVRSIHFLKLQVGDIVRSCVDYLFLLFRYDDLGVYQERATPDYVNKKTIETDGYYLITSKKSDESDITDVSIFNSKLYAVYKNNPDIIYENGFENNIAFINGYIDSLGRYKSTEAYFNQVVTQDFVYIKEKYLVKTKNPEFFIQVCYFDVNSSFVSRSAWARETVIPKNSIVKIVIRSAQATTTKAVSSQVRDYTTEEVANQFFIKKVDEYKIYDDKQIQKKYMHISFDDFETPFKDITDNAETYTSIFDNSFFNWLKTLHDRYGCVFSCYCYLTNGTYDIANVTNKFANEFKENSDWLKFGLHSNNPNSNYGDESTDDVTNDYNKFVTNIIRICGTANAIDVMPRLHYYLGTKANLKLMRDCECGLKGVLGADGERQNYYLTTDDGNYLYTHERYFDTETQLHFLTTDIRLERDNVSDIITSISNGEKTWTNKYLPLIVFGHIWAIDQTFKSNLDRCLDFAILNGYDFDYPQNREI